MTDKNLELSRRKVLAGLGAVGAAGVGAGLGTSAYFNDEESFVGNTVAAGELDLLLDYRATYAGGPGRLDEIDAMYDFDVEEEEEGVYLIGEVPDPGDDPIGWDGTVQDIDFCTEDWGLVNGEDVPVFTLEDVKPGDSGEVTVSLHLCDNPGWLWMNGELTENAENDYTEPEPSTSEEGDFNDPGDPDGEGELADSIETTLWYDENCNNVHDGEGEGSGPICIQLVLDTSGSIGGAIGSVQTAANDLADDILTADSDNRVGVTTFSSGATVDQSVSETWSEISGLNSNGGTDMADGVSAAANDLNENCPEDHQKVMVVFTDGEPSSGQDPSSEAQAARDAGIEIFSIGVGGVNESTLNDMATDPDEEHVFSVTGGSDFEDAIEQVFSQVAQAITGEEIIFQGSLADLMDGGGDWGGLENGVALDGNRSSENREPFEPGVTQCLGLEWELPTDVGNEVQTDAVGFDLGFYAEQYRHNDEPENPFVEA